MQEKYLSPYPTCDSIFFNDEKSIQWHTAGPSELSEIKCTPVNSSEPD